MKRTSPAEQRRQHAAELARMAGVAYEDALAALIAYRTRREAYGHLRCRALFGTAPNRHMRQRFAAEYNRRRGDH